MPSAKMNPRPKVFEFSPRLCYVVIFVAYTHTNVKRRRNEIK